MNFKLNNEKIKIKKFGLKNQKKKKSTLAFYFFQFLAENFLF